MKKVKLIEGIPRWRFKDFFIVRGEIKDCPDEVFALCNGRLIEIIEREKPKKSKKKEETPSDEIATFDSKLETMEK